MNFVIESTPNKIEIDYDLISQIENKLEDNIPLSLDEAKYFLDYIAVSYTHLTLPTKA